MKRIFFIVSLSFILIFLFSCAKKTLPLSVSLEVTGGWGTIEILPEKEVYRYGDELTIKAVPDAGWKLNKWENEFEMESEEFKYILVKETEFKCSFIPASTEEIEFEDYRFERLVRKTINKYSGPIYPQDVENVDELWGSYMYITNLKGIEFFANLEDLHLMWDYVGDLTPLSKLESLKSLYLENNYIYDISPLENLPNLERLWIAGNPTGYIDDYLINNKYFMCLYISADQIKNINTLSKIEGLKNLGLFGADYKKFDDISFIEDFENLHSLTYLNLSDNNISDISSLSALKRLQRLYLHDNKIESLSPLSEITPITRIGAWNNRIEEIASLINLEKLISLQLQNNKLTSIEGIQGMKNLTSFNIDNNKVSDLSPISECTEIMSFHYSNSFFYSPNPLLFDIEDVIDEYTYKRAEKSNVYLMEKENIINEKNDLKLININPIKDLNKLEYLYLNNHNIMDISAVSNLKCLSKLDLSDNLISDIQPLYENHGLQPGDYVNIKNNNLKLFPGGKTMHYIMLLLRRGINLLY